jgi:hypothetical protein
LLLSTGTVEETLIEAKEDGVIVMKPPFLQSPPIGFMELAMPFALPELV